MIGKDNLETEEPVLKVTDKRKFNFDGTVREGVELKAKKAEKPKEETPIHEPNKETVETNDNAAVGKQAQAETPNITEEEFDSEDFPNAEDPASFVNFLTTLASQAAAALGAMPHPVSGQRTLDLETGKYWIDVLAMLKEKTKNNLHPKEQELFDGVLSDLRMQYVQISRIAEEKLKQQAAQKFSASDILGKK